MRDLPWMSLDDVLRSIPAMHKKKVSTVARGMDKSTQTREGWVQAFIFCKGDPKQMAKRLTGRSDWETWKDRRMQFLSRHLKQIEDRNESLWKNGQPSRHHLALVAWGYTPTPKQYKEWLKTQPTVASEEWKKGVVMLQKNPRPIPIDREQIFEIANDIVAVYLERSKAVHAIYNKDIRLRVMGAKIPFTRKFKSSTKGLEKRDMWYTAKGEKRKTIPKTFTLPINVRLVDPNGPYNDVNKNLMFFYSKRPNTRIVENAFYSFARFARVKPDNVFAIVPKAINIDLLNLTPDLVSIFGHREMVYDVYYSLLHEITHLFDFEMHKVEHVKRLLQDTDDFKKKKIHYYDQRVETKAFMQEIVQELLDARHFFGAKLETDFNTMHFDKAIAKYSVRYAIYKDLIKPKTDMLINRAVYQALMEDGMTFKRNIPYVPSGVAYDVFGLKTNPSTHKTTLVPKEKVRLKGFTQEQKKAVEKEIPYVLGHIEKMKGKKILFPSPIRPMTKEEFMHGRSIVDSGHPLGAGHGQYDARKKDIAINKNMDIFDLITNVCHENLHHAYPHWSEEQVRDTTGECMFELYGVYHLGRPFAEEKRKNPKKKR